MKNRMKEAYEKAFAGEFSRLLEGFAPGASVTRKRQRGTGLAAASLPSVVSQTGTAKATANYGGDNTVYRPPEPPTPTQAKLKRSPVKRWDGKTRRPMQSGLRQSRGMMDGGCDCGCDKVQEAMPPIRPSSAGRMGPLSAGRMGPLQSKGLKKRGKKKRRPPME